MDVNKTMKVVTTEQYDLGCLKAQWKNATLIDWLTIIPEQILIAKNKYEKEPDHYWGTELRLLAKKLELVAKEMGGVDGVWADPRE